MKKTLLLLLLWPLLSIAQTDIVSWSPNPQTSLNATVLNNSYLATFPITGSDFEPLKVDTGVQGTSFPSGNSLNLNKYFQYSIAAFANNTVTIKEIRFNYRGNAKRHEVRYSKSADFSNPVTLATAFNNDAAEWTEKVGNITLTGNNVITLNPGERLYLRIYAYQGSQRVIMNTLTINGSTTVPTAYSGIIHVGAAQAAPFNTISSAINALNSFNINGPVTLLLDDALYSNATGETFPIAFNAITGSSSTNTITIKPNAGVNVTVEASNVNNYTAVPAVFKFNGADNIIIDGSNTAGETTRNLLLKNKDYINQDDRSVIWIASVGGNGATNITIKNTNIRQDNRNSDSSYSMGIYAGANTNGSNGSIALATATADNAYIKIINNDFMNVKQGIYINGGSPVTTNLTVQKNDLGAEDNTETIVQPAYFNNVKTFEYSENLVYNLYRNSTSGGIPPAGIHVTGNSSFGTIVRNNIRDMYKLQSDGFTFAGITLASSITNSNILVANNFIYNISGSGNGDASQNGHGINIASGGGYKIYYNTVKLLANQASAGFSAALYVQPGVVGLDIRNNIFVNAQTTGKRRAAIMVRSHKNQINTIFSHLDYNDYYSLDQFGYIMDIFNDANNINDQASADYVDTFSEWKAVTGKDAHSLNVNPQFVSATDMHLGASNSALDNMGTVISEVTKDIDGQLRGGTPDMGADEFGAFSLPNQGLAPNGGLYCSASTTWNGTSWSNGTPSAEKDAIFAADFVQTGGTLTACSVFVTGTAKVIFQSNSNAVVTHSVNVDATATLTFESSCNLIQIENTQNSGNITIKRLGSNLKKLDYTFWSSPVTGTQTLQQFSPATLSNRFYTYSTLTNTYLSVASPSTTTFMTGRSYLIRMPNEITGQFAAAYNAGGYRFSFEGVFTGVPNNGNVYIPLAYGGASNPYNGVGNPYPSPISITDFIDANIANIEGTIWFWRKTNNPNETSYCTATRLGYTANNAPGGSNNDGNNLIADPWTIDAEGILNTGQGFIVKAKNNTQNLVFRNNMRKSKNYANFFRNGETTDTEPENSNAVVSSRIWFNVTNAAADVFAQTMVGYTAQATVGYDDGLDGRGFVDGTVSLYSVIENERLTIQGRPSFNENDVVSLGFKTQVAGEFIISIDHVDGIFSSAFDIYIRDNETGMIQDLRNGNYTFTSEVGTFEDRFDVIYKSEALSVAPVNVAAHDVVIYTQSNQVKVNSPEEIKSITVYDVQGKILYQNNNVNSLEFVSPALTASQQVVIVNAVLVNDQVVSKKIMMN